MELGGEVSTTLPASPITATRCEACLVRIYPPGSGLGTRSALRTQPVVLGRGEDCDIQVNEFSVSRRHARIQPTHDGYVAIDLESTNGTFVNEERASMTPLRDGDNLRIGNCIFRFLAGGNIESAYHEEIYRLTIRDGLTEIHNKRYLFEFLDRELARSARHHRPLSLALFDIDCFKEVNERFGHLGGDFALRTLATVVRANIRKEELFARYGGEEFVIVLPEVRLDTALFVSERVRQRVAEHPFTYEGESFSLTVSFGVAATDGDESLTPEGLLRQADERLYQAKRDGRNRVIA
jgi:diguanylate cyclase (GGDEF)-like protein